MHYLDANKTAGEKARRQLHKNAASNIEQSWRQHPTKHQLYGHRPPIMKTIQVWRTRHAGNCWRIRDELISDVLLWTPTYGRATAGRPAWTYMQQLCEDTRCNPENLPEAMNDREKWWERVRDICAGGTTWWWWWYVCIYIYYVVFYGVCIKHHFNILEPVVISIQRPTLCRERERETDRQRAHTQTRVSLFSSFKISFTSLVQTLPMCTFEKVLVEKHKQFRFRTFVKFNRLYIRIMSLISNFIYIYIILVCC